MIKWIKRLLNTSIGSIIAENNGYKFYELYCIKSYTSCVISLKCFILKYYTILHTDIQVEHCTMRVISRKFHTDAKLRKL